MKILYFTKYSAKGASTRMRSLQYFPFLQSKGLAITYSPLFNDEYLDNLYSGKRSVWNILSGYLRRLMVLFTIRKYDKIVIEYELFPYLPAWAERVLSKLGISYIVDYDDAIFHNYDKSDYPWVRKFLSRKIDVVMKHSKVVVAGNQYLAYRAELTGAKQTESLIVYMFYIFMVVGICVLVGFFYYKIFEKYFIKVVKDTIFESGFPKSITP